ncbi:MAG TPA: hypothetical protein VE870_16725 [Bacteroidales bacterium]|nr:hypothetical protein [Bacteroidales bacterium]
MDNVPEYIVHWDLLKYFAKFDHANYHDPWWKIRYFMKMFWYEILHTKLVEI